MANSSLAQLNLYEETDSSGTALTGCAGGNGFGKLNQGWIEGFERRFSPRTCRVESRAA